MSINPQDYISQPNNWFDSVPEYEGEGYAEFEKPFGHIKGQAKVHLNIAGLTQVVMEIEDFDCEETISGKFFREATLIWLLSGRKPISDSGKFSNKFYNSANNTCKNLTIKTDKGEFKAKSDIIYVFNPMIMNHTKVSILFYLNSSEYHQLETKEAKYWVMPLTNFVSGSLAHSFSLQYPHVIDKHPMRIFPVPDIPSGINPLDYLFALSNIKRTKYFIPFEYKGEIGFIEGLDDYSQRANNLQEGKSNLLITSVMVGSYLGNNESEKSIFDQLPIHYLHLLSLASGSLIGSAWVELRSESGELVSRIHKSIWVNTYAKGHETIDNLSEGGIGVLLSEAPITGNIELQTAIRLVVKGGQHIFDIEDKLAFFFRGADTLTKSLRQIVKIAEKIDLEPQLTDEIKTVLKEAGKQIASLAQEDFTDEVKKEINRIAQNIYQAKNQAPKKHNEAEALEQLAIQQELKDFPLRGIFDVKLKNELDWHQLYNKYRNQVIHEGYLSQEHPYEEFYPLYYHLGDVLIRLMLKIMGYKGEYRRFIPLKQNVSVDWVTDKTPLKQLWRIPPFD